ncbi:serine hydrolase [Heliobacterium mobile]|nr:serine hydrolase [Heliobacterium mobile]
MAQPALANYPDISLSINGHFIQSTPAPKVIGGYIAVPARGLTESLGGKVYWNGATQTMTVVRGGANGTVEIGNPWAVVNGKTIKLAFAPFLSGDRLYLPLNFLGKAFNASLNWDAVDHIASVNTPDQKFQWGTGMRAVSIPDYQVLKQRVQGYLDERPGQVSVYVQDLTTGASFDIGGDQIYMTASTHKLPTVLYLYTLAAQGKVDLNSTLTYTSDYYRQGTGIMQGEPFGKEYKLRELARLAIVYSDNAAWAMLLDYLGDDNLGQFEQSIGGTVTYYDDNSNPLTTPRDMGKYLAYLSVFRDNQPALGNEIFNALENTVYNDRIPSELPAGTVVAHKIGSLNDKFHDVGIVFAPNRPYIISIYSKDGWEAASVQTLADLSRIVYDYQVSLP